MADATLEMLARLIGREALAVLIEHCGGLDVDVPLHVPFKGRLACVPVAAQVALARHFAGSSLYVPKNDKGVRARRDAAILAAYASSETVQSIARRNKLTERRVYMIVHAAKQPDGGVMSSLFDSL